MSDKPKKLVLDYSKWRCGDSGKNKLGEGPVALCNSLGFMCCVGQWSLQIGADENEIMDKGEPHEAGIKHPLFTVVDDDPRLEYKEVHATAFTSRAIGINDDEDSTPEYKIEKLKDLCTEEGIELEVINKP